MKRLALLLAAAALLLAAVRIATARTASRPGVVGVKYDCLNRSQRAFVVTEIDRGSAGTAALPRGSLASGCLVRPELAGNMPKCGLGGASFARGCVLTGLGGKLHGSSTAVVAIINPDSMRPEDLVGANPTPHP